MDSVTFKLVIEHQKEYYVETKEIHSHNLVTIERKNTWNTFWKKFTKKARKRNEKTAHKAELNFLTGFMT